MSTKECVWKTAEEMRSESLYIFRGKIMIERKKNREWMPYLDECMENEWWDEYYARMREEDSRHG